MIFTSIINYFTSYVYTKPKSQLNPHYLSCKPDKPDDRDLKYIHLQSHKTPIPADHTELPRQIDLRPNCPPIYDQGDLGSCTANAIAGAYQFDEYKQHVKKEFVPSRLFIYYNERNMENNIDTDNGASLRDGMKSIQNIGVCHEQLWPYDISKFTKKPTQICYDEAKNHQAISYHRLDNTSLEQLKHCLSEGFPFVLGIQVYSSFKSSEAAKTGYINMPLTTDELLGGHAVMAVGYTSTHFIVRNSWGTDWGAQGYFFLPYDYVTKPDLTQDVWTLRRITEA